MCAWDGVCDCDEEVGGWVVGGGGCSGWSYDAILWQGCYETA